MAQQPVVVDSGVPVAPGSIVAKPGRPGFVIAAPQAAGDTQTGEIAADLARRTGFGLVVASAGAREAYEKRVQEIAQGRLLFYVEIHGSGRRESANRIEISTAGVDAALAARLRTLLELTRDAHLRGHASTPRLEIVVEPADTIVYAATGVQREGMLRLAPRALHLELPRVVRADARERYVTILADFLSQAATLPAGR